MKRRKFISKILPLSTLPFIASDGYSANNDGWHVKQFEDSGLAHYSYAILAGDKIVLVDPGRDPAAYYKFAEESGATIVGIIETHPHADFVSAHLEIHKKTGATIYASALTKPSYTFKAFDEGAIIQLSEKVQIYSINTPGHSPDSISAVLQVNKKDVAVFSGDSLLIGDVGRPDLREHSGDTETQRRELATKMYQTLWNKFDKLRNDIILYPAHGAGSLCGRSMRKAASSTIGYEKQHNYAFQKRSLTSFLDLLLEELPMIPAYFAYDVALNIKGAPDLKTGIASVAKLTDNFDPPSGEVIVDTRPESQYKKSHISGAINVQDSAKFETWLGSVIAPDKSFYVVAADANALEIIINKLAKIGYELKTKGAFIYTSSAGVGSTILEVNDFKKNYAGYTIIDVRSPKEFTDEKIFDDAINIPINELEESLRKIPNDKPVVVSCASGYRSAIGSSIIKKFLPSIDVYDLGSDVAKYRKVK